jgi:Ca-activated chloride channel family protein
MHGFPLNTAKQVLKNLIVKLKPTDTFNVILFSGGSRVLAPRSLAANLQNVSRAVSLIDGLDAGGGTELEAALRSAIQLPRSGFESRSIVVVTDGYIAQERGVFTLINQNLNNTNFFAFGIGFVRTIVEELEPTLLKRHLVVASSKSSSRWSVPIRERKARASA